MITDIKKWQYVAVKTNYVIYENSITEIFEV